MTSDKRRIVKNYTSVVQEYTNVHLKDNTSILDPVFIVTGLPFSRKFNYLFCNDFDRFYFVTDIKYCVGDIMEISCHVDVLESFAFDILSHNAMIERCEEEHFPFFDGDFPIRSDGVCGNVDVGVVGNSYAYYLTVNGGVQ